MSKVLPATCQAGVVTVEGKPVQATIQSQGTKSSQGFTILDEDQAIYFPNSSDDIKELITSLVAIINQVATIATGLDGATNSPGAQATNITQLQSLKTQLDATKGNLR